MEYGDETGYYQKGPKTLKGLKATIPSVCLQAVDQSSPKTRAVLPGRIEDRITVGIMSSRSGEIGGEAKLGEDRGEGE